VKDALEGVHSAEIYALERAVHERQYPPGSRTDDLPPWSTVCPEGQSEEYGQWIGSIDTSALNPDGSGE
jgi:hypothetical protein